MLLFLHGFLGNKKDWDPLLSTLKLPAIALDLPGHGEAPFNENIVETLHKKVPQAQVVIGYSAGGRVALELKHHFPNHYEKLILISSHPGIQDEEKRKLRWERDKVWVEKLKSLPFSQFLTEWYEQPLFATLKNHPIFPSLFEQRLKQNPHSLSEFLNVFSVAKRASIPLPPHTHFIYGSEDLKYREFYHTLHSSNALDGAGHAVHIEKPQECAQLIRRILNDDDRKK